DFQYPLADRPSCSLRLDVTHNRVWQPFSILSRIVPHAAQDRPCRLPFYTYFQYPLADRPSCSQHTPNALCPADHLSVSSRGSSLMQLCMLYCIVATCVSTFSILSRIVPHAATNFANITHILAKLSVSSRGSSLMQPASWAWLV